MDRFTQRGGLVGSGRKLDKNKDGRLNDDECDLDYGLETSFATGHRVITVLHDSVTCEARIEEVHDFDVVETADANLALVTSGTW